MRDPISNLITIIKNGSRAGKPVVSVPQTNFTALVVEALARKGYVKHAVIKGKKEQIQKVLEVGLIYVDNHPRINDVKRLSKPSKRLYRSYSDIHKVKQGFGSTFISTSSGVFSDDEARAKKAGGEILFQIW